MSEELAVEMAIREVISAGITAYIKAGGKFSDIASETGMSGTTIKKLSEGITAYPRFHTVVAVLEFLGYEIRWKATVKVPTVPTRRATSELRVH